MASGDNVVQIISVTPPGDNFATPVKIDGGSTPNEGVIGWAFDAASDEYLDFLCKLEGYGGGGLTFQLRWRAASATANECRWGVGIRRIADDAEDLDVSHSYQFNEGDFTAPSAAGEYDYAEITFTDGADMDSWAENEMAIVRVFRNADHANDDMTGDAQLVALHGLET